MEEDIRAYLHHAARGRGARHWCRRDGLGRKRKSGAPRCSKPLTKWPPVQPGGFFQQETQLNYYVSLLLQQKMTKTNENENTGTRDSGLGTPSSSLRLRDPAAAAAVYVYGTQQQQQQGPLQQQQQGPLHRFPNSVPYGGVCRQTDTQTNAIKWT